ncbi:MAG: hypothetical protein JWQ51_2 [Tardiphaga sp.]|nr:hypothetical protein [Tardiphaga sp.]
MKQAATLQFERAVGEYAIWLAVPEDERSPAPAWWWSSALSMRESVEPMPEEWALPMGLPAGSTIGAGARLMLAAFAEQTRQPWPEEFPRRYRRQDSPDIQT